MDFVPEPPKTIVTSQKWAYSDIENEFGMWRSEYDITDNWTAYTGLRAARARRGDHSAPKLVDKSGKATVSRLDTNRISDSVSGMAGYAVTSLPALSRTRSTWVFRDDQNENRPKMSATADNPTTNIYHNTGVAMPDSSTSTALAANTAIR